MATASNALDANGLAYLWAKMKLTFAEKGDIPDVPVVSATANGLMLATDKVKLDALGNVATTEANGLMSAADKAKIDSFPSTVPQKTSDLVNDAGFATSDQIQAAVSARLTNVYTFKGSVDDYNELPESADPDLRPGDVYDVGYGMNYAWTGSRWDELGDEWISIPAITNAEIDEIVNA